MLTVVVCVNLEYIETTNACKSRVLGRGKLKTSLRKVNCQADQLMRFDKLKLKSFVLTYSGLSKQDQIKPWSVHTTNCHTDLVPILVMSALQRTR